VPCEASSLFPPSWSSRSSPSSGEKNVAMASSRGCSRSAPLSLVCCDLLPFDTAFLIEIPLSTLLIALPRSKRVHHCAQSSNRRTGPRQYARARLEEGKKEKDACFTLFRFSTPPLKQCNSRRRQKRRGKRRQHPKKRRRAVKRTLVFLFPSLLVRSFPWFHAFSVLLQATPTHPQS
jgi:hypothetical protein